MNLNTLISDDLYKFVLLGLGRNLHRSNIGLRREKELGNGQPEPEIPKKERLTWVALSLHSNSLTPNWRLSSNKVKVYSQLHCAPITLDPVTGSTCYNNMS